MSSRKLGGGRILGNGKGLAPPQPAQAPRPSSPFAPSDASTLSLGSQNLSGISPPTPPSPLPGLAAQDLTSNISLGAPSNGSASGAKLVCPICEEEMLTLLQLNRHIDDVHQELPEIQQDEVKTWFDKQVSKAKKFQPLSLINQKLRGLEVFESNETQPVPMVTNGGQSKIAEPFVDPDELITRRHWQRQTINDVCTDPTCGKGLGTINGSVNCRKCGRLFCEAHTMYQMKLSKAASHDPTRGFWVRVCETCYKSREGYNDHHGLEADLTADFVAIRRKRVERHNLEIARLEKRLTKLTRLLAEPSNEAVIAAAGAGGGGGGGGAAASLLNPVATLAGQRNQRKAIEQSVVAWEDDASVAKCPFCQQEFGSWTFRRHHCRICGRVVCADPQTGCSSEVGLNVASHTAAPAVAMEKPASRTAAAAAAAASGQISVDIRMCRDCKTTIFSKRDFAESMAHKPPDQRAYETLCQFERGIRLLMPSFTRALQALQGGAGGSGGGGGGGGGPSQAPPPTHAQIQEAAKIRKRLMDSFTKYNLAAHRIKDLKTDNPAQQRLQKAIYAQASTFLHANMVPLKHVPRMLRSQSSTSSTATTNTNNTSSSSLSGHRRLLSSLNGGSNTSLSPLRNGESATPDSDAGSVAGSEASTAVSAALESEEKELRERLVVLEEQRFLVQAMVDSARGARRFEEVSALTRNVDELDREIVALRKQVGGVEERWEGLYASGAAAAG